MESAIGNKLPSRTVEENDLEIFEGDIEARIKQLIEWMNKKITIKQWSNQEIETKFGKRNAREIIKDGDTGFMNPCSDQTLVGYALLKRNGLHPSIVVDKLIRKKYGFVQVHFAVEFEDGGEKYTLEFGPKGRVSLTRGEYTSSIPDTESSQTKKIEKDVSLDQTMWAVAEGEIDINDFDIENVITQLKRDNNPQTFAAFLEQSPGHGKLFFDSRI